MKKLELFVNEAKGISLDKIEGKDAEKNGTHGKIGYEEPTDNTASNVKIDKSQLNKNMKRLLNKFKAQDDFFIVGRAGWGKTSIVKDLAEKFGRKVITFYLDKVPAEDLGGMPVTVKGKNGKPQTKYTLPAFAEEIAENPDQKFLLFFDEMNQAQPDVQNALMPIVLEHEIAGVKFNNFFVGAAGNLEDENDALYKLSGPLKSRFKPIIEWEIGPESWKQAFRHLHKKWDGKLSKKIIKEFEDNCTVFENPREIEHKIFKFMYNLKQDGDYDYNEVEDYYDMLEGLAREDLSRTEKTKVIGHLAEAMYDYMMKSETEEEKPTGRSSKRNIDMIPQNMIDAIKHGMKFGFIDQERDGKYVKFGVSRENIKNIVSKEDCNAEMLERIIRKFEADGIKFKFEKDEEWKEKGYLDPAEEEE